MTTENITEKTGKVTEGAKKGEMAEGTIIRITDGLASDFMSSEQMIGRQTGADEPFTEIEVGIPDKGTILKPISFKDYTRIGEGGVPANSTLGKMLSLFEMKVDGNVPLIAREVTGRNGTFVAWEIAI